MINEILKIVLVSLIAIIVTIPVVQYLLPKPDHSPKIAVLSLKQIAEDATVNGVFDAKRSKELNEKAITLSKKLQSRGIIVFKSNALMGAPDEYYINDLIQ
ncbi:MAG: hypothetical protein OEZ58_16975 [Gammaproteobacteria bacterium]|nr:hypothetical protein [Gammaproteobacteria bacterium]MDH5730684.1 hypothetical protein [Gammaproteobacteria bacterium]